MEMKKCPNCGSAKIVVKRKGRDKLDVAGLSFVAIVPVEVCQKCGSKYFQAATLRAMELRVAQALAARGVRSGAAIRFMRKALGLRAVDLAELLAVEPETISRWENDERQIEARAFVLVGLLVEDMLDGRATTRARLEALHKPAKRMAAVIRIDAGKTEAA